MVKIDTENLTKSKITLEIFPFQNLQRSKSFFVRFLKVKVVFSKLSAEKKILLLICLKKTFDQGFEDQTYTFEILQRSKLI